MEKQKPAIFAKETLCISTLMSKLSQSKASLSCK